MTELKTENQSTQIIQSQPTAKRRSPKPTAIPAFGGKESEIGSAARASAECSTEARSAKKPRTAKTKKSAQSSQAPSKAASKQVKLTWEPTLSIEATLHQFHEQLNATWIAIDQLKATVEQLQAQDRCSRARSPLEPPKAQIRDRAISPQSPPPQDYSAQTSTQAAGQSAIRSPGSQRSPQSAIPAFRPASGLPVSARQCRRKTIQTKTIQTKTIQTKTIQTKTIQALMQSILQLPTNNGRMAIDAGLWVMASAGLRVGLKALVAAVPILEIPVILLVFVPALLAAYASLFIPQANRIGIYRLLLLALGLFVGGRL